MNQFKIIDFWISVGLIFSFSIIVFLEEKKISFDLDSLLLGYFVIGTWQIISLITHLVYKNKILISSVRKIYSLITLICLITMPMGFLMFAILFYLAPFMAIFYTCICGIELISKAKRPLYQLK